MSFLSSVKRRDEGRGNQVEILPQWVNTRHKQRAGKHQPGHRVSPQACVLSLSSRPAQDWPREHCWALGSQSPEQGLSGRHAHWIGTYTQVYLGTCFGHEFVKQIWRALSKQWVNSPSPGLNLSCDPDKSLPAMWLPQGPQGLWNIPPFRYQGSALSLRLHSFLLKWEATQNGKRINGVVNSLSPPPLDFSFKATLARV